MTLPFISIYKRCNFDLNSCNQWYCDLMGLSFLRYQRWHYNGLKWTTYLNWIFRKICFNISTNCIWLNVFSSNPPFKITFLSNHLILTDIPIQKNIGTNKKNSTLKHEKRFWMFDIPAKNAKTQKHVRVVLAIVSANVDRVSKENAFGTIHFKDNCKICVRRSSDFLKVCCSLYRMFINSFEDFSTHCELRC